MTATANVEQRRGWSGSQDSGFCSWGPGAQMRGREREGEHRPAAVFVNNAEANENGKVLFSVKANLKFPTDTDSLVAGGWGPEGEEL